MVMVIEEITNTNNVENIKDNSLYFNFSDLDNHKLKAYKLMFNAFAKVNIFDIVDTLNNLYVKIDVDEIYGSPFKVSDCIKKTSNGYDPDEIKDLIYNMATLAVERYISELDNDPDNAEGEVYICGIKTHIDKFGASISYSPVDVFVSSDEVE